MKTKLIGAAIGLLMASCGGSPITPTERAPVVLGITPSSGSSLGGTAVRITGDNFSSPVFVSIGGVPAPGAIVESSSSISATTGAHSAGVADVTVTVAGRSGTLPAAFTYRALSPPVIVALVARGTKYANEPANFADIGEKVTVTATVQDPDSSAEQLTYAWSAEAGTFDGTGPSVGWRAPLAAGPVRLSLTVSDGDAAVTQNITVGVHDSVREVGDLARQFLLDFSDSRILAATVMRNFSTSNRCIAERDEELLEVEENRLNYFIDSYIVRGATVNFWFNGLPCRYEPRDGDACAVIPAMWQSTRLRDVDGGRKGEPSHVEGTDYVTAVFEQNQWRLCASYFQEIGTARLHFIR